MGFLTLMGSAIVLDGSFSDVTSLGPKSSVLPPPGGAALLTKPPNKLNENDLLPCEAVRMEKTEKLAIRIEFKSCVSAVAGNAAT